MPSAATWMQPYITVLSAGSWTDSERERLMPCYSTAVPFRRSVQPLSPLQFRSTAQSTSVPFHRSVHFSSVQSLSPVQFRPAAQSSSVPSSRSVQFSSVQPLSPLQFRPAAQSTSVPFSRSVQFSSVQSLSSIQLLATPWTAAHQASLSIANSCSLPKPIH